jgi:hypothetical protein
MNLDNKLTAVLEYLQTPNANHHAGDKQITYLTFDAEYCLEVKKQLSNWLSVIKGYDFNCKVVSMAKTINDFLRNNPRRDSWMIPDADSSFDEVIDFYKSDLGSIIVENQVIEKAILAAQETVISASNPLLLITDLEAIHPFTRFGPIEQKLYSDLKVPLLVFYPGTLSGSSLEFFGFYPPDGNYRSKHF